MGCKITPREGEPVDDHTQGCVGQLNLERDLSEELNAHIASLRRYGIALTGNTADADDLVQETLLRAISYIRDGKQVQNMRGFLFTVLHNVRITQLRRGENRHIHLSVNEIEGGLPVKENQQHHAELRAILQSVAELPESQRQVVLLVCLEGLSYREIAAVTGVPIGTVMSRLARARQALSSRMESKHCMPATFDA